MQKWEYLRLEISRDGAYVKNIYANDAPIFTRSIKATEFQEYLNKLGGEGWELVNWHVPERGIQQEFYFKRQKET